MSGLRKNLMALTPRQDKVLSALLTTPTIAEAARTARVDEKTVRRYLQEPVFQAAHREGRRQLVDEALTMAAQGATGAMAVLRLIITDTKVPASTRVRAALGLLDIAFQHQSLEALEARCIALQHQVEQLCARTA